MASLLGPSTYGLIVLTIPFQGIFQVLAAGGLPPAIAKYVAEYGALDEKKLARQTVYTSLKMMAILGLFFGLVMIFFVAPFLATFFSKPESLYPLQVVGLITPFSVIVGAFRGAFQGVYKMEYILATRAVEQVFMIVCATGFVIIAISAGVSIGLSAASAVLGSVVGFAASAVSSIIIFKKYLWKYIPKPEKDYKFTFKEESALAKKLILFSVPVTITALSEMAIYSACTIIMGIFLSSQVIGYFGAADPIARLPLVISISIATTILPASSVAFSTRNKELLTQYVTQSYRYALIFVIPLCLGIAILSKPIMELVYFTNPSYVLGAASLSILVVGMSFYSVFAVSSSIVQGIGNPRIPMYVLLGGTVLTIAFNWFMIPLYGIEGGALATTLSTIIMSIPILLITLKMTDVTLPYNQFAKILLASLIMSAFIFILPLNVFGLILAVIIAPLIFLGLLLVMKGIEKEDIRIAKGFTSKLGPIGRLFDKLFNKIERITI